MLRLTRLVAICASLALLAVAPVHGDEKAFEFYESALSHFDAGELPEAVVEVKNALQRDPDMLPAHVLLARIYLTAGLPAAADEALKEARRLGGDPTQLWPLRAEAMLSMGRHSELLKTVPEQGLPSPVQARLLLLRGHAQLAMADIAAAEESYAGAVALAPSSGEPLVAMAKAALRRGRISQAADRAEKALLVEPALADAWAVKGDVANMSGAPDDALDAYRAALDLDPEHHDARIAKAGLLIDRENLDEASADIAHMKGLGLGDPRVSYLESVVLSKQGRRAEAREALERAGAELEELGDVYINDSPQLLMLAGIAHFDLGQLERAAGYLERYVERQPRAIGPRKLLAAIYLDGDNAQLAIQLLEEVLGAASNDHRLLTLLSDAYMKEGRPDIAQRYAERALNLAEDDPSARLRLALSKIGRGQDAEGLADLQALYERDPRRAQGIGRQLAALRIERKQFAAAAQVTQQLVLHGPRNPNHHNLHGSALFGQGDLSGARAAFERALAAQPKFLPAQVNLGRLSMVEGRLGDARQVLERALVERPDSVPVMVALSEVATREGNDDDALRWLVKAREANRRSVPAALALVDMNLRQGRAREALSVAEEALAWSPESFEVITAVARSQAALGRRDIAVGLYQRMSRMAGFDAVRQLEVALLQIGAGALQDALYSLDKGLKANPEHLPSRILQIEVMARSGRGEDALALAQALRAEQPELAATQRVEGEVLGMLGRHEEAEPLLAEALRLEPSVRNLLNLTRLHAAAGRRQRSQELMRQWLAERPRSLLVAIALAESHLAAGELEAARDAYQRVLEIDARNASALNNMASVLQMLGEAGALEYARKAHALAPERAETNDTLGWVLVRQGEPQEGLRFLREAYARQGQNAEIRYHLAEALAALGRDGEARRELEAAFKLSQSFAGVEQARLLQKRLSQ